MGVRHFKIGTTKSFEQRKFHEIYQQTLSVELFTSNKTIQKYKKGKFHLVFVEFRRVHPIQNTHAHTHIKIKRKNEITSQSKRKLSHQEHF